MFTDTYHTIEAPSEGLYKDKGSKFIAMAIPVVNEEQIKDHLQQVRKKYYDARHHCYAWALGPARDAFRINDDGEPSGTAGKPIFGQILSHDLTNILIIVVRYFGGVKLGVRGLIDAYRTAAQDAIQANVIVEKLIMDIYKVDFDYPLMNEVMKVLKDHNLEQVAHNFETSCSITFAVRKSESNRISAIFSAMHQVSLVFLGTR
jgi:uncharacterized YigZ family protein